MTNLFQNKRMPFYQFGEPNYLKPIPTEDWIPFIQNKFNERGLEIAEHYIVQKILVERDFVEHRNGGLYMSDPMLQLWLKQY